MLSMRASDPFDESASIPTNCELVVSPRVVTALRYVSRRFRHGSIRYER